MQYMDSNSFDLAADAVPLIPVGEILGAFSYALDLTEAQPAGHCLRSAYIAVTLAKALGLSERECLDVHYTTLMKDLGCSSNAARICQLYMTDDRSFKHDFKLVDGSLPEMLRFIASHTADGRAMSMVQRVLTVCKALKATPKAAHELIETRCERGADIAAQLRLSDTVCDGIRSLDEHWDGSGLPRALKGRDIPLASRIALLAQVADVWFIAEGPEAAHAEIARQSGRWFDPELAALFAGTCIGDDFWERLRAPDLERQLMLLCDGHLDMLADDDYLDDIAAAFGAVIDAKSPFTAGHSERVGQIADALAVHAGYPARHRRRLVRAAMLHDVGKLGVSNQILDKPGKLDSTEWETMQRHAENTTQILSRISAFADMAMIAGAHHERLNGKGYPLGLSGNALSLDTRIIAVADIFDALTADRPYRAALPLEKAMAIMHEEAGSALDPELVAALVDCIADGTIRPSCD